MTVESSLSPVYRSALRRWQHFDKRQLLLSAAVLAMVSVPALADTDSDDVSVDDVCVTGVTCIHHKKTSAHTTSEDGNTYIFYDDDNGYGRIVIHDADTAVETIDSDNYFYTNGYLSNTKRDGAVGIKVDMSEDRDMSSILRPKTTGDCDNDGSGCTIVTDDGATVYTDYEFENYEEEYVTGAAIYLDSLSAIYLTGKGNNKVGIWLDADGATSVTTLTGDIIGYNGSSITIKGDNSYGLLVDEGVTVEGNIAMGTDITIYPHKSKSKTYAGNFGMYIGGYIDGNVQLTDAATMSVYGKGATGMFITGSGVSGNVLIEGSIVTAGTTSSSSYKVNGHKYWSEGGTGLLINSSIGKGIEISGAEYDDDSSATTGSVSSTTQGTAILISPVVTLADGTEYDSDSDIVIDLYQSYDDDTETYTYEQYAPGYAFYNRGSVSVSPRNKHSSSVAAIEVEGTDDYATYLNGGFYNSGTISAASTYSRKKWQTTTATAVLFEGQVYVGGYYDSDTDTYYYDSVSCDGDDCTYTADSEGIIADLLAAQGYTRDNTAAFVNDGEANSSASIAASITGKGGGTATAIEISEDSYLSSIYNSGSITASATTSKTTIAVGLNAYAIQDKSGTLQYVYNSGTIKAVATSLDDDSQIAAAIDLSTDVIGDIASDGVTIVSESDGNSATYIYGDIIFGEGDNQKIYLSGAGSSYASMLYGDLYYGKSSYYVANDGDTYYSGGDSSYDLDADDSGDTLSIGAFGVVYGGIYAYSPVDISIANNGYLYILNNADDCQSAESSVCGDFSYVNAGSIDVANGGSFSIIISESSGLNDTGYIQANDDVTLENGASFTVGYDSYITSGDYVLLSTSGDLDIENMQDISSDLSTPMSSQCVDDDTCGTMPYLFKSQTLTVKYYDADGNEVSSAVDGGTSQLVLEVETKDADELGLTGYAKSIFSYANEALAQDDDLGAAMVNSIKANTGDLYGTEASDDAQRAYDSYAPNASGGTRAIAVALTDQATGVVGARQRALRNFSMQEGDLTLWTQEFVQQIKNPGQGATQEDGSRARTGFKDHGFGIVVGMDAGSPSEGWYGGALTYFSGDVNEIGKSSYENQTWVVASGYASKRGHGWFLDAKVDAGYGHIKGTRYIKLTYDTTVGTTTTSSTYTRYAQNAHSALMVAGGVTGGTSYTYGAFTFQPQVSLDAMALREDGYTEHNPVDDDTDADGFSLKVKETFATSLRGYIGTNVRYDLDLGDNIFMQPAMHFGVRYDFLADPLKVKAAFKDLEPDELGNQSGSYFSLTGPRPSAAAAVVGTSVGLISGAWSLNLGYDFVRGPNMNIEQAATLNLVGRI